MEEALMTQCEMSNIIRSIVKSTFGSVINLGTKSIRET